MAPETRYARSGEVSIAYQVFGEGPFDAVVSLPASSHTSPETRMDDIRAVMDAAGSERAAIIGWSALRRELADEHAVRERGPLAAALAELRDGSPEATDEELQALGACTHSGSALATNTSTR
jgi:hypothetical protein